MLAPWPIGDKRTCRSDLYNNAPLLSEPRGAGPDLGTDQGRTRRREGPREAARTAQGALGKSRLDGKEQDIRVLLGKNVSKASIAKILDVSRSALYHFIETRKIVPS